MRTLEKYLVSAGLFTLLFTIGLNAQTNSMKSEDRTIRFFSTAPIDDDILYEVKGKAIQVKANSGRLSKPHLKPGGSTLEFFRLLPVPPGAPEGTKPLRQVLAQIPLVSADQQIVLLAPNKEGSPLPIGGMAFDALPDKHTLGNARIINLSSYKAAIAFEKEKRVTEARSLNTIIDFPLGVVDVLIGVEVNNSGKWDRALYSKYRLNERSKIYVILHNKVPTEDDPAPYRSHVIVEQMRIPWQPPNL